MKRIWVQGELSSRLRAALKLAGLSPSSVSRKGTLVMSAPGTKLDRIARIKANGWAR